MINRADRRRLANVGISEEQFMDSHRKIINLRAKKKLETHMDTIDMRIEQGLPVDLYSFYLETLDYHDA
jgi:hypothetical protein